MTRVAIASLAVLLLSAAACASSSNPRPPSGLATRTENGEKVICRMERPIGSNIAEMVCRTEESVSAQQQASQDAMRAGPKNRPGEASR